MDNHAANGTCELSCHNTQATQTERNTDTGPMYVHVNIAVLLSLPRASINPKFGLGRRKIRHVVAFGGDMVNIDPRKFIKYA